MTKSIGNMLTFDVYTEEIITFSIWSWQDFLGNVNSRLEQYMYMYIPVLDQANAPDSSIQPFYFESISVLLGPSRGCMKFSTYML